MERRGLARLNSDGSLDTSFAPDGVRGSDVQAIVVQPDDKVLAGGLISVVGDLNNRGIIRLNADGSLDPDFRPGISVFGLSDIVLRTDGRMFIAGSFQAGDYVNNVALLNADGTRDISFSPAYALFPNPGVLGAAKLALQPDGGILASGTYAMGNDIYIQGFYRLHASGSVDESFNPGDGLSFWADSFTLQPNGKILVAHGLAPIKGVTTRPHLARLESGLTPPPS